jgi:hypothetical protein
VAIKTAKTQVPMREQSTRALRFKVTNTGAAPIAGASFTVATPDDVTLLSSKMVPAASSRGFGAHHNKTAKAHAQQDWTWPLDLQPKKTRTYTLKIRV